MVYDFTPLKSKVEEIKNWLRQELAGLRSGRVSPALLDGVMVPGYGQHLPLKQLASVSVLDPQTLSVNLWDKSLVKAAETALVNSGLGVSVIASADSLLLKFPPLSAEKRELLCRLAAERGEASRISLRQERDRVWQDIQTKERGGEISEDDKFRFKDEMQKIIDGGQNDMRVLIEKKAVEIRG